MGCGALQLSISVEHDQPGPLNARRRYISRVNANATGTMIRAVLDFTPSFAAHESCPGRVPDRNPSPSIATWELVYEFRENPLFYAEAQGISHFVPSYTSQKCVVYGVLFAQSHYMSSPHCPFLRSSCSSLPRLCFPPVVKAVENPRSKGKNRSVPNISAATSEGAMTADMSDRDEPWPPAHNIGKPGTASSRSPPLSQLNVSGSSTASSRLGGAYVDTSSDDEAQQHQQEEQLQQQQRPLMEHDGMIASSSVGGAVVAGTLNRSQRREEGQKMMILGDRNQRTTSAEHMMATSASPEEDDGGYYHATLSTYEDEATVTDAAAAEEGMRGGSMTGHEGLEARSGSPSSNSSSNRGVWASFVQCLGGILRVVGCGCRKPTHGEMLIYGGFLLNVTTKGTIACFETLGAEYAMTRFGLTSAEAGSTFATFGAMGVCMLLSMRVLCKYWNDVQLVLGGVSLMALTCLIFVTPPAGAAGLLAFHFAVFLIYSVGYPVGHTAVRLRGPEEDVVLWSCVKGKGATRGEKLGHVHGSFVE